MKIFFTCHRLPYPPKRGGKIRPFNIIRHFKSQGHNVTVASLSRSPEEMTEGEGLRDYCDKLLIGDVGKASATLQMIARLPTASPSSMGYFYSRRLHEEAARELSSGNYDLVFAHCSSAAQYVRTRGNVPSILDFGDMDSQKWLDYSGHRPFPLSLGYRLEGSKLQREEAKLAANFSMSTCTTRAELQSLQGLGTAKMTGWFPNGVDSEYFCPGVQDYDRDQICFIGRMDYFPNQQCMIWFCDKVLPTILDQRPATTLTIVGAEPSAAIQRLGERPAIEVTGTVPDVRSFVRRSALSVAPLMIARGTQNKILESMAMGVPVVSTDVAAGGVDAVPGEHLLTASDPGNFAKQVLEILDNYDLRMELSVNGRDRVRQRHTWDTSMEVLDGLLARL